MHASTPAILQSAGPVAGWKQERHSSLSPPGHGGEKQLPSSITQVPAVHVVLRGSSLRAASFYHTQGANICAPCVNLGFLVRLSFALRSVVERRVCAIAPWFLFLAGGPLLLPLCVHSMYAYAVVPRNANSLHPARHPLRQGVETCFGDAALFLCVCALRKRCGASIWRKSLRAEQNAWHHYSEERRAICQPRQAQI
jgi:hypothetical protein